MNSSVNKSSRYLKICLLIVLVFTTLFSANAQKKKKKGNTQVTTFSENLYNTLEWRLIGPFRGGRSAAVTGVPGKPKLFYFGATGGGVWRTLDGGQTWENISDGFFGGSVGAVAVSGSDNNVIYVGGGEKTVRGNVSYGYGMWKSTDAGDSWQHIGLGNARHIPRVRIHPNDPDLVYAAVLGDLYKPAKERGVYRSKDGGKSWEKLLFTNENAGAIDLILDPNNPRIIYASTWNVRRTPYSLSSGGEGSALWKSKDGGDTWTEISKNKGFAEGTLGIIGVSVSPVNSKRVYAIAEAEEGGVFRSDDGGNTWHKMNEDRALRQRAWYYTRIYADPKEEHTVYVMNVSYHKSTDGGKTFEPYRAPHGDHHDFWVAPEDNRRMIIGDDGGAQISYDGGDNWSTYYNQPTAQFYRVTTDNHFPYRIYGAQQDNSTVRISHRSDGRYITEDDWEESAGGESAHLAVDPADNDIVYGGSYGGYLTHVNHKTGQQRTINVWPDNPMGAGAEAMKYRFQWNFPIFFSPHDPKKLYACSNALHVTTDEGASWEVISPDLTRNDTSRLVSSGGPITQDNTGVEYYCTIFAAAESPHEAGVIWTGSDDGLIHLTKDGGKNWENVTPSNMPEWIMINSIEVDPFEKGGAYIAATMYKSGNYAPYLYKTKDYGKTWTKITNGIPNDHFTRVVRADPKRKGLLYCGTESGMYISFDDGANWQSFQLNLPMVPVTDLAVKEGNLIAATQGRSFWIIDDLTVLHQLNGEIANADFHLYQPKAAYRLRGSRRSPSKIAGQNPHNGVTVHYYLREKPDSADTLTISILTMGDQLIKEFSSHAKEKNLKIKPKDSVNLFVWDFRYPDAEKIPGMVLWSASLDGPEVAPGKYKVKMTFKDQLKEQVFEVLADPRSPSTIEDYQAQFDFLMEVRDKVDETHKAIRQIQSAKNQLKDLNKKLKDEKEQKEVVEESKKLIKDMSAIEETLYQNKAKSGQDLLNYPIKLNNKLAHLTGVVGRGNFRPTEQSIAVKNELVGKIDEQLKLFYMIRDEKLPAFNQLIRERKVDIIQVGSQ